MTKGVRSSIFWQAILSLTLLTIAALPWLIAMAFTPIIPTDLSATPTAYAIASSAKKTATAVADLDRRHFILGVSEKNQTVYRCPGEANKTPKQISAGLAIRVFGWYQDSNGTIWFLINDDRNASQEWIRRDDTLKLSPPDYKDVIGKTSCRS